MGKFGQLMNSLEHPSFSAPSLHDLWGITPAGAADNYFFQKPAADAKAAYDKAAGQSQQNLQQIMGYIGGQQNQALGYYKPLQQMFSNAYGTGGIQGPQIPKAGGGR